MSIRFMVCCSNEARPPRFVMYSVTSESEPELAESSDEESSDEEC